MILQFIQFLMVLLVGSNNEPTYDLRRRNPATSDKLKGINWTFVALVIGMVLFFLILFLLMVFGFSGTESGIHYNHFGDIL